MLDFGRVPDGLLVPVANVVDVVLAAVPHLAPSGVMLVGAWCRNVLHRALGHTFDTTATVDLDLALALSSWDTYRVLSSTFPRVGRTGLRYRIASCDVDLLPFGAIENPEGVVEPPSRDASFSVWSFGEVFATSLPLTVRAGLAVRIPTIAGFAAAKLGAWLDRSAEHETKDATDLALILHWYAESSDVQDRLYGTSAGNEVLIAEEVDVRCAAARLLGLDVAELLGPQRQSELLARWPGNSALLSSSLRMRGSPTWSAASARRQELVDALTRGLASPPSSPPGR